MEEYILLKKIILMFLLLCFMNTAFAKEYVINELDLKIVLPNNLTVITAEEAPDEKDILRIHQRQEHLPETFR